MSLRILLPTIFLFVLLAIPSRADITTGLVGWWKFNEGTGTLTVDSSGYGNTGTLTNMADPATPTSGWNPGRSSWGLAFDGNNDSVACGNVTSFKSLEGAISFWVNPTDFTGGRTIFHAYESVALSAKDYIRTFLYPDGKIDLVIEDGDVTKVTPKSTASLRANKWTHIVWVQDGVGVKLYMDGVLAATTGINSGAWWTDHLAGFYTNIGVGWGYFYGSIDDVRLYNRELTQSDITELYNSGFTAIRNATLRNAVIK